MHPVTLGICQISLKLNYSLFPPSINSKLLKPSQIQKDNSTLYQQGLGVFGSVEDILKCGGLVCVLLAVKYSGMD